LSEQECKELECLVRSGKSSARRIRYGLALLKANAGWTDEQIGEAFSMGVNTVQRLRQRLVEEGLEVALGARSHAPKPWLRKMDGRAEAGLIAVACSETPQGQTRWTLRMLADRMVELGYVESISHETVRQVLKKRTQALACPAVVHPA